MFSSPTPAPGSRAIITKGLISAGLIDRDTLMRDVTDRPGGRKSSSKIRHHRTRPIDAYRDQFRDITGPSRTPTVNIQTLFSLNPRFCQASLYCSRLPHLSEKLAKLTFFIANLSPKLANRIAPSSDPLSIRGAARPTAVGRIRRNALSLTGVRASTPPASATIKTLDIWREFVQHRWNPEARYLNLEASLVCLSSIPFFLTAHSSG
jgi:nuclear RNA export factor